MRTLQIKIVSNAANNEDGEWITRTVPNRVIWQRAYDVLARYVPFGYHVVQYVIASRRPRVRHRVTRERNRVQ